MNEHSFDPLEAARRATEAMDQPFPARPPAPQADTGGTWTPNLEEPAPSARDLEAELRDVIEHDEAVKNAVHADAMMLVARHNARMGRDPTIFRPHSAATAIAIARLAFALDDGNPIADDPAFRPMSEDEAKAELDKTRRTAGAFKAIGAL